MLKAVELMLITSIYISRRRISTATVTAGQRRSQTLFNWVAGAAKHLSACAVTSGTVRWDCGGTVASLAGGMGSCVLWYICVLNAVFEKDKGTARDTVLTYFPGVMK